MDRKLFDSEYRFMQIVWDHAPVRSGVLVDLCNAELGWKKSTTYTVIKKLCEKGFIENNDAVVSVLISQDEAQREESTQFVERTFGGSLPSFIAAFLSGKKISDKDAEEIRQMIDEYQNKE